MARFIVFGVLAVMVAATLVLVDKKIEQKYAAQFVAGYEQGFVDAVASIPTCKQRRTWTNYTHMQRWFKENGDG